MKINHLLIAAIIFLGIALISTRQLMAGDGYWTSFDYAPRFDTASLKEFFFSMFRWDQTMSLDEQKRMTVYWVYFFLDEPQFQAWRFGAEVFLILLSAYFFTGRFVENEYRISGPWGHAICFAVAFFYLVNPISISHFNKANMPLAYAFFPAAFYFGYMTLNSERWRHPIILGLVSAFLFSLAIHNLIYVALMMGACGAVAFIGLRREGLKPEAIKILMKLLLSGATFILLTAYISLPSIYTTLRYDLPNPGYVNSESYVESVSEDTNVFRSICLDINAFFAPQMGYNYPFGEMYYPVFSIIIGLALASCILRPGKLALSVLACICVFVLLSKAISPPFGGLYERLVFDLPAIGWMFRAGTKFLYMLPLFFSLGLAHLLCVISRHKQALAAAVLAVLLAQGIFAWPVWTGNFHSIEMLQGEKDFFDILALLKNTDSENVKVAWYSDYSESAPVKAIAPKRMYALPMRYLIEGGESVAPLAILNRRLGLEYLLIDNSQKRPFYDIKYAKYAIVESGGRFDQVYDGGQYDVFRLNNGTTPVYTAGEAALDYGGFHTAVTLWSMGRRNASVIFMENDPKLTGAVREAQADSAVFGPGEIPAMRIDDQNAIYFPDNPGGGWVKYNTLSADAPEGRMLSDQFPYNNAFIYKTGNRHGDIVTNSSNLAILANISLGKDGARNGNGTIVVPQTAIGRGWLSINGSGSCENSGFIIRVIFYDKEMKRIKTARIMPGYKKDLKWSIHDEMEVPWDAGFVMLVSDKSSFANVKSSCTMDIGSVILNEYADESLEMSFKVEEAGEYEVYLRYLKNPDGRGLVAGIDDLKDTGVATKSSTTAYDWARVYDGWLGQGVHALEIADNGGSESIDVAYIRKKGEPDGWEWLGGKDIVYALEAEKDFEMHNAWIVGGGNYSDVYAAGLNDSSVLWSSITTYRPGIYGILGSGSNFTMFVDGNSVQNDSVFLSKGKHNLTIRGNGLGVVDYIALVLDAQDSGGEAKITGYTKADPTTYDVAVNSTRPYFLVLTDGYNPLWMASVDGEESGAVPVYGIVNGFFINKTGEHTVHVYFGPQPWFILGLWISGAGLLGTVALIARGRLGRWMV
jgi:hypothetical protein